MTTGGRQRDMRQLRGQRYGIAVGSAVADICGNEDHLARLREANKDVAEPMSDEQQQRAVTAAARAALVVLPDLDVIAAGSPDSDD